jgi:enoyl-CoA hydratase
VSAVHPADVFAEAVGDVLARLRTGPIVALGKTKHAINATTLNELEGAFGREHRGQSELVRSRDFREGAKAFMQRRKPNFTDA